MPIVRVDPGRAPCQQDNARPRDSESQQFVNLSDGESYTQLFQLLSCHPLPGLSERVRPSRWRCPDYEGRRDQDETKLGDSHANSDSVTIRKIESFGVLFAFDLPS